MVIDKLPMEGHNSVTSNSYSEATYEDMSKDPPSLFDTCNSFNTLSSSSSSSSTKSNVQPIIHLADLEFKDEKLRILKEAITFKGIIIFVFIFYFLNKFHFYNLVIVIVGN